MTGTIPLRVGPLHSRPRLLPRLLRHAMGAPVTLTYLLLLWAVDIISPTLLALPPSATRAQMAASAASLATHPWSVVTSGFWVQGAGIYVLATIVLLLVGVPLEERLGSLRYAVAAAGTHALGIAAAAGFVWAARGLTGSWSADLMTRPYLGPSAALCGVGMAATTTMSVLWRRRSRVALLALLLLLALYDGSFQDLIRLGAAVFGLALGPLLFGRRPQLGLPAMSRREGRMLIALGVAAAAIGPVIAGLAPHSAGPLAVLRFLFTDIQPVDPQALQSLCADPGQTKACEMMHLQLRAGAGGIFMAVLPSVLLLLCADGLRRGRRFAWGSALIVLGAIAVLAGTHIAAVVLPTVPGTARDKSMGALDLATFHHPVDLLLALLLPTVLFLIVLRFRSLFTVSAPRSTYRRLAVRSLTIGAVLSVVYVAGGLALAGGFTPVPGVAQFAADVPDRFLPLGYSLDIAPAFFPESTPAVLLYEGTGVIFWALTGVLIMLSYLQPAHNGHGSDQDRARDILRTQESSPLSWMTTWPGNTYWFSPSGTGFVAFRVISGIALALGDPVAPKPQRRGSVESFALFCSDNGWIPCFYSVTKDVQEITTTLGWGSVQVAQETLLPLDSLTFKGKKFQDIRTALNKAQKEGIRAEWVTYRTAPLAVKNQIEAISEEWIADRKLPEMGFTLGGIDELTDPEVRCLLAIDEHRLIHAVTSWLPVYRNGAIVGWTLDFMRRRNTGFRTSTEFLIAIAALTLKDEGYEFISLSGAPLARTGERSDTSATGVLDRLLDRLGTSLEPVYGFRSLLAFKDKFGPRYEPLYMVYPDGAALPAIANAITRAYLPEVSFVERIALAKGLLRRPRARKPLSPTGAQRWRPSHHGHTGRQQSRPVPRRLLSAMTEDTTRYPPGHGPAAHGPAPSAMTRLRYRIHLCTRKLSLEGNHRRRCPALRGQGGR